MGKGLGLNRERKGPGSSGLSLRWKSPNPDSPSKKVEDLVGPVVTG
jgi:hypothetical protein